jgi:hypothetical protein
MMNKEGRECSMLNFQYSRHKEKQGERTMYKEKALY